MAASVGSQPTGTYLTCRAGERSYASPKEMGGLSTSCLYWENAVWRTELPITAAQAGVLNLTLCALALEWARNGITVNAIGAGWTEGMGMIANEQIKQQLARYIPNKRLVNRTKSATRLSTLHPIQPAL